MFVFQEVVLCPGGERPWGRDPEVDWDALPTESVAIEALIATTDHIILSHLYRPESGPAWVFRWRDRLYLKDGHHRVLTRALVGLQFTPAKIAPVVFGHREA